MNGAIENSCDWGCSGESIYAKCPTHVNQFPTHQHQHTIPVEYAFQNINKVRNVRSDYATNMCVTKLRCICGNEIDR